MRKWKYKWIYVPTGAEGETETLCRMTSLQFLSFITYCNNENWIYIPLIQDGMLSPHDCKNVKGPPE